MLDLTGEGCVGEMAWFVSGHLALNGFPDQGKVADDIQQLMTGRLIVEIQIHVVKDTAFFDFHLGFLEEGRDMIQFLRGDIFVDKNDRVRGLIVMILERINDHFFSVLTCIIQKFCIFASETMNDRYELAVELK